MAVRWWSTRDRWAVVAAVIVPFAVCLALVPVRTQWPTVDAALVLVGVVVAVAAYGHRAAGVLASLSAALWCDFWLLPPYRTLAIADRRDLGTFVLLAVVGLAVTELAVRGRRYRSAAADDHRYLDAVTAVASAVDTAAPTHILIGTVDRALRGVLPLTACRFETAAFGGMPRLDTDGALRSREWTGGRWDVDQYGWPDGPVEVLATTSGAVVGRFVLDPVAGRSSSAAARRCAALLVGLAASGLAAERDHRRNDDGALKP